MANSDLLTLRLCVINADTRKERPEHLKPAGKLADYIYNDFIVKELKPQENDCLITASEFIKTGAKVLYKKLPDTYDYHNGKFKGSDQTSFYWDEKNWPAICRNGAVDIIWSDEGKYGGVVVEHETQKQKLLYVSVHLPHKGNKKKAESYRLLNTLIDEAPEKYEIDGIIVAGDFNLTASKVRQEFASMTLGIENDDTFTTKAGNSIDNVLTSVSIIPSVRVVKEGVDLTHYPLISDLQIKDTDNADRRRDDRDDDNDDDDSTIQQVPSSNPATLAGLPEATAKLQLAKR